MKVLVTGGAGFIGSHVVDRLQACGHAPRIFDLVQSLHHDPDLVETKLGDLSDTVALAEAMRDCSAVVHLAAVSDVNDVVANPDRAELVNARGTELVLEAARTNGIRRVVYASTIWVYGGATGVEPLDESTLLTRPPHLYTATKLAGEMYCHSYAELYGLQPTVLRFGIPHGPRARATSVVATFVRRASDGKPLVIMGDGLQTRQFIYVEDLAAGILAGLTPVAAGRTYNLVRDELTSVREIAEIVRDLVRDVPIVYTAERQADLENRVISGTRAWHELDWRPRTSFRQGVRRYVESLSVADGTPSSTISSRISGSAATVMRQEPETL
ncbi:MAG: NAD-dependent epimerase/dehydratase family protein [Actinobacteria bacterium]|nr:MAG: NAD-dependent epimerase/dehydratase family protein [Actinomycetota bacterium]